MVRAGVTVNGQSASLEGVADAHDGTRLVARSRTHRAPRRAAPRASAAPARCSSPGPHSTAADAHRMGGHQRLPGPRRRARRPGGRHRRGLGPPRRAAPGAARDGRARRLAVWLLHAWLHLQHGRRVLPARDRRAAVRHGPRRARPERIRPARAERQPVPMHRLPADPRRRIRAGRARRRRPVRRAARPAGARPHRRPVLQQTAGSSSGPATSPRRFDAAARSDPDATVVAGSHRLGRRGQPPRRPRAARGRASTGWPNCANCGSTRTPSRSAPPSPSPRSSDGWPAGCRCWPRYSPSSRLA